MQQLTEDEFTSKIEYMKKEQGNSDNLMTVKFTIPPRYEAVIQVGILKSMRPFEDYPNDPQRGISIMQMPILYRSLEEEWQMIQS